MKKAFLILVLILFTVSAYASQYYVVVGGQNYGPADVDTLRQWKNDNRITDATQTINAQTGAAATLGSVLSPAPAPRPVPRPEPAPRVSQSAPQPTPTRSADAWTPSYGAQRVDANVLTLNHGDWLVSARTNLDILAGKWKSDTPGFDDMKTNNLSLEFEGMYLFNSNIGFGPIISWQSSKLGDEKRTFTHIAAAGKYYVNLGNEPKMIPYFALDLGMRFVKIEDGVFSESGSGFAYGLGVGLLYSFNSRVALDVKLAYNGTTKIDLGKQLGKISITEYGLKTGLTVKF